MSGSTRRVVVVGGGMAGLRVAGEIRTRDPLRRLAVTVVEAESTPAYNRVLLSRMLADAVRHDDVRLPVPDVELRSAVAVSGLDRRTRQVHTVDGGRVPYDAVVLATGAVPYVPSIPGLCQCTGALARGVFTFRTLDDCLRIMAAARTARRAVVIGGGLLGVEAARGLAHRGLRVELLHAAGQLMERQLDVEAARELTRTLERLGLRVRLTARVVAACVTDGRIRAIELADGTAASADLVVLACGVRPNVALARTAGIAVRDGIVVDDRLRSVDDPSVYAVGECAEHAGTVYGLVAPAWEQAAVVADLVTQVRPAARYRGSRTVARSVGPGIDLAAMGGTQLQGGDGVEVVRFADPTRGTYRKIAMRGGRLVGAILLGEIPTVGTVTRLYDRGAPVPRDRLSLLFSDRNHITVPEGASQ